MLQTRSQGDPSRHFSMRVRQNTAPAAIGTAFLVYFGFFAVAEPTGTDLYHRAAWAFYHTLRLGGLAMGAVALWSMLGQPMTLVVDAVVTVLIGVLLILTGLAMAVDGGAMIQTIINLVCGGMFISSGARNWRDYQFYAAPRASDVPSSRTTDSTGLEAHLHALPEVRRKAPPSSQRDHQVERKEQRQPITPVEPPPEGFLASLAKKPPPTGDEGPLK